MFLNLSGCTPAVSTSLVEDTGAAVGFGSSGLFSAKGETTGIGLVSVLGDGSGVVPLDALLGEGLGAVATAGDEGSLFRPPLGPIGALGPLGIARSGGFSLP